MSKHWKLSIDTSKICSDVDYAKIVEMLQPKLVEPLRQGFRFLFARYGGEVTAYARAFDIECSGLYCASIEVEEVSA